ncbi:proline/glycine betaine ABC transporter permease [Roseobacter sp.]|uniref:ABC transporter permease n=1 Tax=Roseobacter sp. TaxID=1907202 RepID=UPI0032990CD2
MTVQNSKTDPNTLNQLISDFVGVNAPYYIYEFNRIQCMTGFSGSWNIRAAIFGPVWAASRGVWGFFWTFLILELFALVQISRGLWGELGADQLERYERLLDNIARREQQAADLTAAGDPTSAEAKLKIAENLRGAADIALEQANSANESATVVLIAGLGLFALLKLLEGFTANIAYEAQFVRWRSSGCEQSGVKRNGILFGVLGILAIWPLTLIRFTVANPEDVVARLTGGLLGQRIPITEFPVGKEYFSTLSLKGDDGFDWLAIKFGGVFDRVTTTIRWVLDALEILLIQTPWPVVMFVIIVMAYRLAGLRVAIFTTASLAYLASMGLWELSMITVALIGAGAFLCVIIGIPLGIWFGKSTRAYKMAEPVLDFMQTMPAFVYLIPIIAFFGTGKPPGVLATLIFAMPPVIRLTALGMRGVPDATKEAAIAFGCSPWQLLTNVELPLALPSIMTGINQTILMSLSMVVIASLIGAEGLGALILEALQYAAKGQGLLGGVAILLCAMVIDRIAQGAYRKSAQQQR